MINVEGDYKEIVDWLDIQLGSGVQYTQSHGGDLNFGLFSIVSDLKYECDPSHNDCIITAGYPIPLEQWDIDTQLLMRAQYENNSYIEHYRQYGRSHATAHHYVGNDYE